MSEAVQEAAPEAAAPAATLLAGATTEAVTDPAPIETAADPAPATAPVEVPVYSFTAPEGQAYDPEMLSAFEATARELSLSQEAAQTLLDRMAPTITERQAKAQASAFRATVDQWADQVRKDPELGGANLERTLQRGEAALDKLGTPALRSVLHASGFANHPDVIRLLARVGELVSEDSIVGGKAPTSAPADPAALFYPSMRRA